MERASEEHLSFHVSTHFSWGIEKSFLKVYSFGEVGFPERVLSV